MAVTPIVAFQRHGRQEFHRTNRDKREPHWSRQMSRLWRWEAWLLVCWRCSGCAKEQTKGSKDCGKIPFQARRGFLVWLLGLVLEDTRRLVAEEMAWLDRVASAHRGRGIWKSGQMACEVVRTPTSPKETSFVFHTSNPTVQIHFKLVVRQKIHKKEIRD